MGDAHLTSSYVTGKVGHFAELLASFTSRLSSSLEHPTNPDVGSQLRLPYSYVALEIVSKDIFHT